MYLEQHVLYAGCFLPFKLFCRHRRWKKKNQKTQTIIRLFISATQSVCFQPEPSQTSHIASNQSVLLPVQNRRLPNAQGAAGVRPLTAGIPQALAGLASHQHGGDVVDLVSGLGAGALLGLRDPTTFTPAPAGVEDQDQTQDGQQKGDHPALRGGGWHLEQRCTKKGRARGEKKKKREAERQRQRGERCQVQYRSKSNQRYNMNKGYGCN